MLLSQSFFCGVTLVLLPVQSSKKQLLSIFGIYEIQLLLLEYIEARRCSSTLSLRNLIIPQLYRLE